MATRSNIAYKTPEGKIRSVYAHYDGYPENNGKILIDNYDTTEKVAALVALGSISTLGIQVGEQQDFDDRESQNKDWTLAYHRDRGKSCSLLSMMTFQVGLMTWKSMPTFGTATSGSLTTTVRPAEAFQCSTS